MQEVTIGYLENLNIEQQDAVTYGDGPLLVLAGAGTGKTRVLTTRIAHLIASKKAFPDQILAVTFTNKAAKEIIERTEKIANCKGIWSGTFHSLAAKILRIHAEKLGLPSSFNIIDTIDQERVIKNLLEFKGLDPKKYPAKSIIYSLSRFKDQGKTPEELSHRDCSNPMDSIALELYAHYNNQLKVSGSVDFGDLLLYNIILFRDFPDILDHYQQKFKYILVDEYQDTNYAQSLWLKLLARKHHNITCVGDDDQAIYGWRGANVENILSFAKDYPEAKVIRLEKNYRSTASILDVASNIINNNISRHGKTLWTDHHLSEKVKLLEFYDEKQEAFTIAKLIEDQVYKGIKLSEIAVLVRAGFLTRLFEEAFNQIGLAYRIYGGVKFYERMEVKDVLAYLRVAYNPHDSIALARIINVPKRGIGSTTVDELLRYSASNFCSLYKAVKDNLASGSRIRGLAKLSHFIEKLEHWHKESGLISHSSLADLILADSGYIDMWKEENPVEAQSRLENINELLKVAAEYNNLQEFLEHISLVTDADNITDNHQKISIMTIHSAKGLEFGTVFLPGWEEGLFPNNRTINESGHKGIEEERRLAYVAITRAKHRLFISYANHRRLFNNSWQATTASRFVQEIPNDLIEYINFVRY